MVERKVETCLKHHCGYPNMTAGATRGSARNHACAIEPTVLRRALIIKAQACRWAHIISICNSFIHDVLRGHAQQGWRHGGTAAWAQKRVTVKRSTPACPYPLTAGATRGSVRNHEGAQIG